MWSKHLAAAAVVGSILVVVAFRIGISAQSGAEKAQMAVEAVESKGDGTAYARYLTDDFSWINFAGRLRDKKTVVDELRGSTERNVISEVRSYPDGAVLVGTRKIVDGQVRFLRLWVQRGNAWQLAAHQGVRIGDSPVPATNTRSSPMPPHSGPAAEIQAIHQAIDALAAGNRKGDAKNFAASVTDQFITISPTGIVATKEQRIKEITQGTGPAAVGPVERSSTRIYGDLAVTLRIAKSPNGRAISTIIHLKQGGKWLRAAVITSPIVTGKSTND